MPFYEEMPCNPIHYNFNVYIIIKWLENKLKKTYNKDHDEYGKKMYTFVEWLEDNYVGGVYFFDYLDGMCEKYIRWDEIVDLFKDES